MVINTITNRRSFIKTACLSAAGLFVTSAAFSTAAQKEYGTIKRIPHGAWAVMMTPFDDNLEIDYPALKALITWYEDAGMSGLFANCLSSEMYNLSEEERIELTRFVVDNSKLPVVSTGTFYESPEENIDFIKKIYRTGVDGVVLITSVLVDKDSDEQAFLDAVHTIVENTENIPLGLYECPSPYKRLISPDALAKIVATERFVYLKDTSCVADTVNKKIAVSQGSLLGVYNAHSPDALDTIRHGGAGISPIAGNFYPELYTYLCKYGNDNSKTEEIALVDAFIQKNDPMIGEKYPLAAKYFMQLRGVPVKVNSRRTQAVLEDSDKERLESLLKELRQLAERININLA